MKTWSLYGLCVRKYSRKQQMENRQTLVELVLERGGTMWRWNTDACGHFCAWKRKRTDGDEERSKYRSYGRTWNTVRVNRENPVLTKFRAFCFDVCVTHLFGQVRACKWSGKTFFVQRRVQTSNVNKGGLTYAYQVFGRWPWKGWILRSCLFVRCWAHI